MADEFTTVSTTDVDVDTPIKAATGLAFKQNDDFLWHNMLRQISEHWDNVQ